MDERKLFSELGLTFNEGKVYSELIKHGKLSAANVSSKAGVPYGKIYVVLRGLIDKGLVRTVPEKTKMFSPAGPESLEKIIESKKKFLEGARKKVKELREIYEKKDREFLIIGEGDKGFWKIAEDMIDSKRYAYNIKWTSQIKPGAFDRIRKRLKKKIDVKNLVRYEDETKKNVDKFSKAGLPQAKFDNEGVALSILDDREVMIGLIKKNTTFLIRDEAFCKVMKKLFLAAYDKAEKINVK